jgi:hypothetical protein
MSDNRDEKLDLMLRSRRMESTSADLSQRIILRARELPQKKSLSLWQWLRDACFEFHLPSPTYVVATALIVGMAIGFSVPPDTPSTNNEISSNVTAQSVFSADEALL